MVGQADTAQRDVMGNEGKPLQSALLLGSRSPLTASDLDTMAGVYDYLDTLGSLTERFCRYDTEVYLRTKHLCTLQSKKESTMAVNKTEEHIWYDNQWLDRDQRPTSLHRLDGIVHDLVEEAYDKLRSLRSREGAEPSTLVLAKFLSDGFLRFSHHKVRKARQRGKIYDEDNESDGYDEDNESDGDDPDEELSR